MTQLAEANITIVGLGLMGGSLAAALHGKCASIIGIDPDESALTYALEQGWIKHGYIELIDGVREANIIVLAVPVRLILKLLDQLRSILTHECILIDLGSTKKQITTKMASLPNHVQAIGGHPMCGREVSGIFAADAGLFQGSKFLLTPIERTTQDTLDFCYQLINGIGAFPLIVDPDQHDHLVAVTSHVPYLASASLVSVATQAGESDDRIWEIASSGFRDTTRLASSDLTMIMDILMTNRESILTNLKTYQAALNKISLWIEKADEKSLRDHLTQTRNRRMEWLK